MPPVVIVAQHSAQAEDDTKIVITHDEVVKEQEQEWQDHKGVDIGWSAKIFIECMIVVNAAQLGMCVDPENLRFGDVCHYSEHCFIAIFLMEAIVRIYYQKASYFRWRWNQFDFFLVSTAVLDNWIVTPILNAASSPISNIYVIRLVRLLRILRILKVLRSKKELQMLLEGLMGALKSMIWVATLLGFLIYASAIICVTLFSKVHTDYWLTFHTVPEAIFTLFTLAIVADWTEIVVPVATEYPWAVLLFIMFTIVATFGILNLIIGVITERTTMVQREYAEREQLNRDNMRMDAIEEIADIIFATQEDGSITRDELGEMMEDSTHGNPIKALVSGVSLPEGFTILDCHPMFDRDATGSIERDEFIQGMKRLIFSNAFQRSCMTQSAIADVLVEVKAVESRLAEMVKKELVTMQWECRGLREEVHRFSANSLGDGGGGDSGAGGKAGQVKAIEGKAVAEAKAAGDRATEAKVPRTNADMAVSADASRHAGGKSFYESLPQQELNLLSQKLLLRLREPMVLLLTEGLQAEVCDKDGSAYDSSHASTRRTTDRNHRHEHVAQAPAHGSGGASYSGSYAGFLASEDRPPKTSSRASPRDGDGDAGEHGHHSDRGDVRSDSRSEPSSHLRPRAISSEPSPPRPPRQRGEQQQRRSASRDRSNVEDSGQELVQAVRSRGAASEASGGASRSKKPASAVV